MISEIEWNWKYCQQKKNVEVQKSEEKEGEKNPKTKLANVT